MTNKPTNTTTRTKPCTCGMCALREEPSKQKTARVLETTTLGRALSKAMPPGYTDVWSGLGEIWFDDSTGGTWVKANPDFVVRVGKIYKWRDRDGRESSFLAMTK